MKKLIITVFLILILSQILPQVLAWQIERPHRGEPLDIYDSLRHVQKKNTDGYASVGLGVAIDQYIEDFDDYSADFINWNVTMTANSRKYITYDSYWQSLFWIDENWLYNKNVMTGVGDNWGCWMDIPDCAGYQVVFRFYGGHGSGEYTRVWISSNGFIAFDLSNSTNSSPSNIPNVESPNAVIAALWTDLDIDGSASIITGTFTFTSHSYFVVIWKDAYHRASGERLTFQLILENAPQYDPLERRFHQSDIWISYKSVSAINTDFTVGIEDHEGMRGHGGLYSGGSLEGFNDQTLYYYRYASSYFLKKLTLSFYDTCSKTRINIKEAEQLEPRGYNIQWDPTKPEEPAPSSLFGMALAGTAVLLLGGYGGVIATIATAGECILVTLDWADAFASLQYNGRQVEVIDFEDNVTQQASATAYTYDYVVDASLSLIVHWILDDTNDLEHTLTITAEAEYYEYTISGGVIEKSPVTTSATLNVKPDNELDGAVLYEGTYSWLYLDLLYDDVDSYYVEVTEGQGIFVEMTPPPDMDFDLYLYDPDDNPKDESVTRYPGYTEQVGVQADTSGYWKVTVAAWSGFGFYSLKIDLNNAPNTPSLTGPTSGYKGVYYTYKACAKDPDGDSVKYTFYWGDSYTTTTGYYGSDVEVSRSHPWSTGTYSVKVKATDVYGAHKNSSSLTVTISGGDGGCPYVYTWAGQCYLMDNNLLSASEISNGADVEDFYMLEQPMAPLYSGDYFSVYSLKLGEFENEHSYIDKVRLIAVDHDIDVKVALTPEGQILTYGNPNSPVSAVDNYGCDWLPAMLEADDTYYRGFPEDYLLLDFGTLDVSQAAKLVLRANVEWKKDTCIHVQVLDEAGDWTDATALRTRYHWSTLIVDLADYLPNPDDTLKIRLYFTGIHKIDYVGLDTTPQADITTIQTNAVRATHSTHGKVTLKLLLNDQAYAELVPGEQIKLKFILLNTEKTRTFIIYIEGHYETIP